MDFVHTIIVGYTMFEYEDGLLYCIVISPSELAILVNHTPNNRGDAVICLFCSMG